MLKGRGVEPERESAEAVVARRKASEGPNEEEWNPP